MPPLRFPFLSCGMPSLSLLVPPVPFSFLLKSFPSLPVPTCVKLPGKMLFVPWLWPSLTVQTTCQPLRPAKKEWRKTNLSLGQNPGGGVAVADSALEMLRRAEATEANTCTCCHPQEQVRALQAGQKSHGLQQLQTRVHLGMTTPLPVSNKCPSTPGTHTGPEVPRAPGQ